MDFKRPYSGISSMTVVPVPQKRARFDDTANYQLTEFSPRNKQIIPAGAHGSIPRSSSLFAPNMLCTGHEGEIYCGKFIGKDGATFATSGFDRKIFLWNTYGECDNIGVLIGHGGAVLDLEVSTDAETLYTASTDKTIGLWDIEYQQRIKRIKGHKSFVNSCHVARRGPQMICSGSDDGTIKLWDRRQKNEVHSFQNTYQVLSVTFNDSQELIYSGGIDNIIHAWDVRKLEEVYQLAGHTDTVTGLSLSPEGTHLLSNAMDNTLRIWDIRPFAQGDRCVQLLQGHKHTFEKNLLRCAWSADSRLVTCGSGDSFVFVWDAQNPRRLLYKLPGHNASVNETAFHPVEPIIMSVASDKRIFLGEINVS
ncbi:U5 small nuclear ribonucleoprotein [Cichlidogyrus casuarinus]|uniref:U5 small nuclear ribonucleoprotein n=1 Tax=Cichlidogyrus casuarinus TaxID=1844966 RepID=A0ABD2Q9J0_9PLAT